MRTYWVGGTQPSLWWRWRGSWSRCRIAAELGRRRLSCSPAVKETDANLSAQENVPLFRSSLFVTGLKCSDSLPRQRGAGVGSYNKPPPEGSLGDFQKTGIVIYYWNSAVINLLPVCCTEAHWHPDCAQWNSSMSDMLMRRCDGLT